MNPENISNTQMLSLFLRSALESVLVLSFFLIVIFRSGFAKKIKSSLGVKRFHAIACFFVLWAAVHLGDRWQYFFPQPLSFYPFIRFAMYQTGTPHTTISTYRLVGRYSHGQETEINAPLLLSRVGLPSVNTRFRTYLVKLNSDSSNVRRWAKYEFEKYATGLARLEERRTGNRVVSIEMIRRNVDAMKSPGKLLEEKTIAHWHRGTE